MVSLSQVKASNAKAASALLPGIVAVFAGATAGIGEMALNAFAKATTSPRIFFIGRSQEAGDRLVGELREVNSGGEYVFMKADMSLLKNVDEVCRRIKEQAKSVNVLFMSQGTLKMGIDTAEGLPYISALTLYSRSRLAANLLPLLRSASSLRRAVTVLAGTKEGQFSIDDIPGRNISLSNSRGHAATALTLSLEALARQAPEVSFIHNFPGAVNTNLIRNDDGLLMQAVKYWFKISMTVRGKFLPAEEVGERHAYLCLSMRYPPKVLQGDLKAEGGEEAVAGTDGKVGSGVYSVDWDGESSLKTAEFLERYRREGAVDKFWEHMECEFKRVTNPVSV